MWDSPTERRGNELLNMVCPHGWGRGSHRAN
jgi:hypothetical protein